MIFQLANFDALIYELIELFKKLKLTTDDVMIMPFLLPNILKRCTRKVVQSNSAKLAKLCLGSKKH